MLSTSKEAGSLVRGFRVVIYSPPPIRPRLHDIKEHPVKLPLSHNKAAPGRVDLKPIIVRKRLYDVCFEAQPAVLVGSLRFHSGVGTEQEIGLILDVIKGVTG